MSRTIRARVKGGLLEPLEKPDLPEGTEVLLVVVSPADALDNAALLASARGWKNLVDADTLIRDIYADRLVDTRGEPRF